MTSFNTIYRSFCVGAHFIGPPSPCVQYDCMSNSDYCWGRKPRKTDANAQPLAPLIKSMPQCETMNDTATEMPQSGWPGANCTHFRWLWLLFGRRQLVVVVIRSDNCVLHLARLHHLFALCNYSPAEFSRWSRLTPERSPMMQDRGDNNACACDDRRVTDIIPAGYESPPQKIPQSRYKLFVLFLITSLSCCPVLMSMLIYIAHYRTMPLMTSLHWMLLILSAQRNETETKLVQNCFETVSKSFCFSYIS